MKKHTKKQPRRFLMWAIVNNSLRVIKEIPHNNRAEADRLIALMNAHPDCKKHGGPFFVHPWKKEGAHEAT